MYSFLKEQKEFRGDPMHIVLNASRKVRFTKSTLRQASIREKKGPSLGKTKVVPRQRSPYAPKFEDRSHEETGRQQRCVRSKAWDLAKICTSSKRTTGLHSSHLQRSGFSQVPHQESRVGEFGVDSGTSMHIVSEEDLNWTELATMWTSRSPTTVMTANGEVQFRGLDHKVLNEDGESRNNHQHVVVVQDMTTQGIQSFLCRTKNFSKNAEEFAKVLGANKKTKSFTHTIPWNLASEELS